MESVVNIAQDEANDLFRITIGNEMTIYSVDEIKEEISKGVNECKRIEINLSTVEDCDSAGVQLLLMIKKELSEKSKELKIVSMSGVVKKRLESYDVLKAFDCGEVA